MIFKSFVRKKKKNKNTKQSLRINFAKSERIKMAQLYYISAWFLIATIVLVSLADVKSSTEYNRYLAHIFQKYGNGGTMSFEVSFNKVILIYTSNTF